MSKIQFRNAAHRDFVLENLDKCKVNDCYHRAFFYVMGISEGMVPVPPCTKATQSLLLARLAGF